VGATPRNLLIFLLKKSQTFLWALRPEIY